jgi:protein phosphatase 1 regulatory subunit 7
LDLNLTANHGEIKNLKGIEGFVNLTLLSAANQHIETIDLGSNTKLDTIYLPGNKPSNIDLSKNTKLIFIDIQSNDFDANSTIGGLENASNLKDLDLSWNYLEEFSIHNESLEVVHISHNDLKSINTDGASSIKHIYMPLNKLETVNLSSNISLETLLLSGNKLQNINIENNSELIHLKQRTYESRCKQQSKIKRLKNR